MLTERILECFEHEVIIGTYGTRDVQNRPKVGTPFYINTSEDRKNVRMIVSTIEFEEHRANLESNGELALTCACVPSHEAFQIKGTFKDSSVLTDTFKQKAHLSRDNYQRKLPDFGFPASLVGGFEDFDTKTVTVIEFEVKEIFDQTPKTGAGHKI